MLVDDIPWPELGNVSRGATRGNQGQKGVLSQPDRDGRCILQLRVQAGVLTVLLNRQSSEAYATLNDEVQQALKLTKTYWRKARRRQDYDAMADQEHMELHEWLQQLKDKVMSHLELLMQRGDIKGPPYIMPDELELTFLRKFLERQQAGIPHNPRLREAFLQGRLPAQRGPVQVASRSASDGPATQGSDSGWGGEDIPSRDSVPSHTLSSATAMSAPPVGSRLSGRTGNLEEQLTASAHHLQTARAAQRRAQKTTADAFAQYTAALEAERSAAREVALHEDRRDTLVAAVIREASEVAQQNTDAESFQQPRRYSYSSEQDLARFSQWNTNGVRPHTIEHSAPLPATYRWESDERSNLAGASHNGSPRVANGMGSNMLTENNPSDVRKRVWDAEESAQLEHPRKRSNHGSLGGSPAMSAALAAQVMPGAN